MLNKNTVAFYIGDYRNSGGTERSCIAVVNGLARKGQSKVYLICTNSNEDKPFYDLDETVKVVYLNIQDYKIQYFVCLSRLYKAIRRYKIDSIVAVEMYSLLFVFPVVKLMKLFGLCINLVAWEHFNFTVNLGRKERDFFRKIAARFADNIVVLTERDVELWRSKLKIKRSIVAINNPSPYVVNDGEYNTNTKNILAIGRLTYQKGFDKLLDIWGKYITRFGNEEGWRLFIIGSGPDEEKLKHLIVEYGISKSVKMIANTPDIGSYYSNGAFLAMTSRFEGLPMTLIESQSFGLPIIVYDCLTGPSEIVSENSGFLVKMDDEHDYLIKLNSLITNSELRLKMSANAKEEVKRFAPETVIEKWVQLLKWN